MELKTQDGQAWQEALAGLQAAIGYAFKNLPLLQAAVTHTSYANEAPDRGEPNERLEFLGDAVLEVCVSTELYHRYPGAREGELTRLRSSLVSGANLAIVARGYDLEQVLRLGRGEEEQGGRQRGALLADAFEAVLGAVYLDGGLEAAAQVVARVFAGQWPQKVGEKRRDWKSLLQEATQRLFQGRPHYQLLNESGPEHEKQFEAAVILPEGASFVGSGTSRKGAEQEAAEKALKWLEGEISFLTTPPAGPKPGSGG